MSEDCNSGAASLLLPSPSNSKIVGEKRGSTHRGHSARKRVKMKDLDAVVHSVETNSRYSEFKNDKENTVQWSLGATDASQQVTTGRNAMPEEFNFVARPLILNTEACKGGGCVVNFAKDSLSEKQEKGHGNLVVSRGINVDLNAEDATGSVNLEPANSSKGCNPFKSKDVSESGSCVGPLEQKDPMTKWKQMKEYGFWSPSHAGIPKPKHHGRKSKNEMLKKKMELAKREQVNRFTKIAAPSGLLNDLNPGIINHVRNRKQVLSIIENLVRSEKHESTSVGSKHAAHCIQGNVEVSKRDQENVADVSEHQHDFACEEGALHSTSGSRQARKFPVTTNDSSSLILEGRVCDCDIGSLDKGSLKSCMTQSTNVVEDDALALKLSSEMRASMSSTGLSNEESSNVTMVSSLSLKAATVASQWLELLQHDIKGRLSALRRSRRKVQSVITTELPFLLSKEFGNNQDYDPCTMKMSAGLPTGKIADMHRARWTSLFDHMDEALSEEEKKLECWLNQVKEKQLLCDQGIQHVNWSSVFGLQQLGNSENNSRAPAFDSSEKDLAVNAAAASIYSTCNFLLSKS
ncbi:hypothetical protein AAZX31_14G143600 [Glycine max]|uniref:Cation-transporting ATPase n=4 Tax=Glycine subgen. Soja TaxID=1462606 RepID=K7M758_SOYBN|nr:uncharacterized protein LOC100808129 isoform X1 [Glycine max]XP_028200855.1 uncharacterized protein LOC114385084 isoform X1 [Glycine soja]KAG5110812.1 hypothetical protein JHK82_040035 [Glycine max]KAG5122106.1 hypothetical protein JHK84_040446 [Glycine max]KHN30408.1 hypothetical protein glysoja_041851 [Glycine soja]KRH15893.1 hypothetical protein GLYMA_14G117500v4 [Glycine max]RZB69147.1 hypothetical protein D0Y65_038776 [Glycine soja]|eukprot:XP_006596260.1 uncharacterized protein LOC100808129 isoform X1 [Glycine max]